MKDYGDAILEWIRTNLLDAEERERVTKDTDLIEAGVLDSLKIAELVFFLESEHDVVIDTEHIETTAFRSVDRVVKLIQEVGRKAP